LKSKSVEVKFTPVDNKRLANLCGAMDEHLRQIETALDISIARRGELLILRGFQERTARGARLLQSLYAEAARPLSLEQVQLGLAEAMPRQGTDNVTNNAASSATEAAPADDAAIDGEPVLRTRRNDLRGRTDGQRAYIRQAQAHDLTFAIGPAGTGKTYLAVACAVDALERDAVKRIVLVRPAVEAGERLGFLPGDLAQKVDPYLRPLYDALYDLMGYDKVGKLLERGVIELAPLAYMRGRTLNHAFVILDEAQNTTPEQMKMFLTRLGFGSRAVVTGDVTQVDLPRGARSGLVDARQILAGVRGVAFAEFTSADVVRHPLVQRIVDAYDRHASQT
jgi:phosphate starvation-inducible PhoH-like protein